MRKLFLVLALLLPATSYADKAADVARVEEYLSSLTSIVADFNQVDTNGNVSTGKFYLKRPGKMRWEYNPPVPVLLVSDGKMLVYYDSELNQINYLPIDDTLAAFLARPRIQFDSESTKLTNFIAKDAVIAATVIQKSKPAEGSLTLEFTDKPLQLRQMIVKDASGQETRVQLQNAQFGPVLDNKLFKFVDPRKTKGVRR